MYLITTLAPAPSEQALINKVLPKELILRYSFDFFHSRIFSYLDMKTLCRCAQTCRLWNVLALDGSNWQRVDLFTFQKDVKAATVENLARRCGGFLKKLSLKGCENIQDSALRSFTAKCANIEHLSLYKCKRVTDATCENLGRHCHKLVHLNLENCTAITDRALRYISDGCPNLQYLNISWCDNIQDKGISMVLNGCKNLTTLIMKGCEGLTEQVFANSIDNMKNLEVINLLSCFVSKRRNSSAYCTRLSAPTVSVPIELYTDHRSIIDLLIAGMQDVDVGYFYFFWLIFAQSSRSCLASSDISSDFSDIELSGCSLLSDAGFTQLARHCKSLTRMDLEDCSLITDATIHSLSTNCNNLSELSLSHCELITDESIHCLCTNNKDKLQVLELDNCPQITDSALSHMRHAKALKRIDLYDCQNVSKEAIQRFKVMYNQSFNYCSTIGRMSKFTPTSRRQHHQQTPLPHEQVYADAVPSYD
ncbi:leucine Rich repeat-containing domain protein [Ancylostoma caninum]|uniref:Leucine Rich repeat-containing domain protein n=1 Tax=Ancylostoma caninum TaxID=29170 RepID=A0A368FL46_ANCCA|nr:leucine Rich repeat-containing domain protein [Ancylostoma caninum]